MSDEMAVGDKGPSEENKVGGEDAEMETTDSVASSEPPIETTGAEPQQSAPVEVPLPPDAEDDPPETIAAIREELGIKDDNLPKSDNVVKTDTDTKHKIEMVHEITVEHKSDEEVQDNDIYTDDVFKQDNDVKAILEDEGQSIVRVENTKIDEDKILASEGKVTKEVDVQLEKDDQDDITPTIEASRGMKRRASAAFSDDGMEEFKGFDNCEPSSLADYSRIVERLEAEVSAAVKTYKPLKTVMAAPTPRASKRARQDMGRAKWSGPLEEEVSAFVKSFLDDGVKAGKRQRQGTDSSRPSSALSSRSDDAAMNPDGSSAGRTARRATAAPEMSSPLLRVPLERGWKRELVYRAAQASTDPPRRNADIYYYTPQGKKLRSTREVSEHLSGTGLTIENFSFFKEPLGLDDPDKEIIRDAKINRRVESPVPAATPPAVEGKRTPKPKPPKGASPEPTTPKSPPAKIKVKSMGSRLSSNGTTPKTTKKPQPQTQQAQPQPATTPADNNNTAAWKKPSEGVKTLRSRIANGAASPPAPLQSPRRRGRPKVDDTDHFTAFHSKAQEHNYNIAVQIFQYLGMRDLARSARVCKLWQTLAAAPALWRHVRMKNSHVSDWAGLCAALKRHGTRWLDLRKMLLPPNDALFWDHFAQHIGAVDTLERLELCRCPARAVQAACERLPGLRALAAPAIRDARLDPSPLALLPRLELLRLKSLAGLSLTRDLRPLAALTRLQHLSLTSIKELGWCACEVVGQLEQLESLELGECSFGGSFAAALGKLVKLRRLRLERGVAHCAAPALLRALSALPKLTRLELVNFDVKVGFDDALAECKNIQRLLIIPTYVSQSATTNKQVLSGVLRLKETLTHLMWGVTIELLRVTELFIDQCEAGEGESKRRDVGECIPVLKPVPGCRLPDDHRTVAGPPQVEILPIPTLQRLLSAQLPNTKLKLLRIPFHATWRQSLADFQ
ncbi:uncharacterized protein LOC123865323 isoform X2 [Maniola jurtina]|uniref:uncharacterized protein LOC123865323 isoform X2 n=1 Tax=Maniola jurtina TaxID=191418 RepID=UPI001E68F044|nr:uncharacterized protein LOC123865323 isoform X2 [Maniola jurtina]